MGTGERGKLGLGLGLGFAGRLRQSIFRRAARESERICLLACCMPCVLATAGGKHVHWRGEAARTVSTTLSGGERGANEGLHSVAEVMKFTSVSDSRCCTLLYMQAARAVPATEVLETKRESL